MDKNLIIVGLGPGQLESVSVGTLKKLKSSGSLLLRTGNHPAVGQFADEGIKFTTLDYIYEQKLDFDEVYDEIALTVIAAAKKEPTVYAVPGHPLVGEKSVSKIINLARDHQVEFEILPAMSFLDSVLTSLNLSLSEGLKVVDGLGLTGDKPLRASLPDPHVPNLIMQVYNPLVASDVKLSLMEFYPDEHPVKVISAAGIPGIERIANIPLFELDRLGWIDHLTCVYLPPYDKSKSLISRFPLDSMVDILEKLRGEGGCPWDREQTHQSLKKFLVEETYETLEAIDEGNMYKVCEELGDLLLQIIFHAQIAREHGDFDMNDVVEVISEKLVRRHPHVFGGTTVRNSDEVSVKWDEIKKEELIEKGEIRESILDGIPKNMSALSKADKIQRKAAKVGFDWPDYTGALNKVEEEITEVKEAIFLRDQKLILDEMGDLLFAVINLARLLQVDSDEALIKAIRKFEERFKYMEILAAQTRKKLDKMDLKQLDSLWEEVKNRLK